MKEFSIKGIRQGLLISLGAGTWEDKLSRLEGRLATGTMFFRGGRAALDVGDASLEASEIGRVREMLARHDIELWAVLSSVDDTVAAAARQGLVVNLDLGARSEPAEEPPAAEQDETWGALVVERTLRSGQTVRHPGHVIVFGDVHPGAEVVAGGHVVVWGKLRGMVHAGAFGDESARVCALDLVPTQLRIAGCIARSPEDKRRRAVPEMAQVHKGRIEAVPWRQR